jgi:protein-S-isoprenylcysteine O-methyltransferase Ste14
MTQNTIDRRSLARKAVLAAAAGLVMLMLLLFPPAGTLAYWEAWVWLAILYVPMIMVGTYLIRRDPALLARRLRAREKAAEQRRLIGLSYVWFLAMFVLPGLDRRWGWSHVPVAVVVAADLLVLVGYGVFARVLRENSYLSRTVEVDADQRVITTGPYAIVRHPMYVGILLLYLATPIALGSYWAVIACLPMVAIIVARTLSEERILTEQLAGYADYMQRTRYRLIPGIW